jgi:rfaE bifunctional protein nucleotidyltransferase chain/domain
MSKVIFTNGCFDILHRGHVELLRYCASLGNEVIVGLNSDASVNRLKGPERPINREQDRKLLLESIRYVDKVIIFSEDTPLNLIKRVNPDIIVKGGDYAKEDVIGSEHAKVMLFDFVDGYSTTKIAQRTINR